MPQAVLKDVPVVRFETPKSEILTHSGEGEAIRTFYEWRMVNQKCKMWIASELESD